MASQNILSVTPELMAQIEAAASAANQTPDEWAAEVMQRKLQESRVKAMFARNERYARKASIKESDVPDLVHQARLERGR